jgi:hypothetical protein
MRVLTCSACFWTRLLSGARGKLTRSAPATVHTTPRNGYLNAYFNAACRLSRTCSCQHLPRNWGAAPTSSSILASAMSASLPLPLAIFWASVIWFLTAYCRLVGPSQFAMFVLHRR